MSRPYIVILLFKLYAEYIMINVGLDEAQAGIKTAGGNINNLRYADDTTFMAEIEEELKTKIMASGSIIMASKWRNNGNSHRLYFLGLPNHCRW